MCASNISANTRVMEGCKELRLFGFYKKRNSLSNRNCSLSNRMLEM